MSPAPAPERFDAIVVGARCAGSATAIAFARAGRRVVALDRARFPADTLSTHLLFAGGVAELAALDALERVEALGAPRMPAAAVHGAGLSATGRYTPVDGIDYGLCVRRTGLDAALVETAREAGAEVREGTSATELVFEGSRVAGVRARDGEGHLRELRAPLVVGADGRRSTVASLVGAEEAYRSNPNERACLFAYWEDPRADLRHVAIQWREGAELGTAFPCDGGLALVLLMPPAGPRARIHAGPQAEYERAIAAIPGLGERLHGCTQSTKVRFATDLPSYFRRSSGPGWALPGDSGHFKDPVTAQGIRDALRYGRRLGERSAPALEDPALLDRALADWEHERERDCLEAYQWTNKLARAEPISPIEHELYREMAARPDGAGELLDVFSRVRRPAEAFSARRGATLAARALARRGADRPRVMRALVREVRDELRDRIERLGARPRAGRAPMRRLRQEGLGLVQHGLHPGSLVEGPRGE